MTHVLSRCLSCVLVVVLCTASPFSECECVLTSWNIMEKILWATICCCLLQWGIHEVHTWIQINKHKRDNSRLIVYRLN